MNHSPGFKNTTDSNEIAIIPLNVILFRGSAESPFPRTLPNSATSLTKAINDTREMYVTGTKWRGEGAIRLAVSNWRTGGGGDEEWDVVRGVLEQVMQR